MKQFHKWLGIPLSITVGLSACQLPANVQKAGVSSKATNQLAGIPLSIDAQALSQLADKGITDVQLAGQNQDAQSQTFKTEAVSLLEQLQDPEIGFFGKKPFDTFEGFLSQITPSSAGDRRNLAQSAQYKGLDPELHYTSIHFSYAFYIGYYLKPPSCQPEMAIYLDGVKLGTFAPRFIHPIYANNNLGGQNLTGQDVYVPEFIEIGISWRSKQRFKAHVTIDANGGITKYSPTQTPPFELKTVMSPVYCSGIQPTVLASNFQPNYTLLARLYSDEDDYFFQRIYGLGAKGTNEFSTDIGCPEEWKTAADQIYSEAMYIYDQARTYADEDFVSYNAAYNHFKITSAQNDSARKIWHPFFQTRVPVPAALDSAVTRMENSFRVMASTGPSPSSSASSSSSSGPSSVPSPTATPEPTPTPEITPNPEPTVEMSAPPSEAPLEHPVEEVRDSGSGPYNPRQADFFPSKLDVIPIQQILANVNLGSSTQYNQNNSQQSNGGPSNQSGGNNSNQNNANPSNPQNEVSNSDLFLQLNNISLIYWMENYPGGTQIFQPLIQARQDKIAQLSADDTETKQALLDEIDQINSLATRMFNVASKAQSLSDFMTNEVSKASGSGAQQVGAMSKGCRMRPYAIPDGNNIKLNISYASLSTSGDIFIHGTVSNLPNARLFRLDDIVPDFQGDIELLEKPETSIEYGVSGAAVNRDSVNFIMKVPKTSYRFTQIYLARLDKALEDNTTQALDNARLSISLKVTKVFQTQGVTYQTFSSPLYEPHEQLKRFPSEKISMVS